MSKTDDLIAEEQSYLARGRLMDSAPELLDSLAKLILVGNRLARGDATKTEWYQAVKDITHMHAPICVLTREGAE